ncbi:MAG TPA: hypothetical protein VNI34_06130 [Candidatus Nitrosotalea sp.]|nr:hypothetical protein [Candidatus Nitrosotalea sp.]
MTKGMRWRIVSLEVVLVALLGAITGVLMWGSAFSTGQVGSELIAQKIYFPPQSQIKPGGALDPAVFPAEIRQYAGQQVDNGVKARVYANDFISIHLSELANGKTYAQVSTAAQADPKNATLAAQKATLFQGETLRAILLNAYGWWTLGLYAGYAAIGTAIAALAVLGSLVFELAALLVRPRKAALVAHRAGVSA